MNASYPIIARGLWILFTVITIIILLNLLIALMGNTYEGVQEDGVEDDWRTFQAAVILEKEEQVRAGQMVAAPLIERALQHPILRRRTLRFGCVTR